MNRLFFLVIALVMASQVKAQSEIVEYIKGQCDTIKFPLKLGTDAYDINFSEKDTLPKALLNKMFAKEYVANEWLYKNGQATYYFENDSVAKCKDYGIVIDYNCCKYKPIGEHYLLIIQSWGDGHFNYADYYMIDKKGVVISYCPAYESEISFEPHERNEYDPITSSIDKDGIITTSEIRDIFRMTNKYEITKDGHFKMVSQGKEIWNEYDKEYSLLKLGKISDPDGYVNVRRSSNSKSEILYTLPDKSSIIYYELKGKDWVEIVKSEDKSHEGGFIHSSRVK